MTQHERRLNLATSAKATLREIRKDLDLSAANCGGCNRPHYNNWPEYLIEQKACSALTKVDGIINELTQLIDQSKRAAAAHEEIIR